MGILITLSLLDDDTFGTVRGLGGRTISSMPLNRPPAFPELRVAARVVWIFSCWRSDIFLLLDVVVDFRATNTTDFFAFVTVGFVLRLEGELLVPLDVSPSLSAVEEAFSWLPSSVTLRNMRSGMLCSSLSSVWTIQCVSGIVVTGDDSTLSAMDLSSVLARRMPIATDFPWTIFFFATKESLETHLASQERNTFPFESRECSYLHFVADLIELRRIIRLGTACRYHCSLKTIQQQDCECENQKLLELLELFWRKDGY